MLFWFIFSCLLLIAVALGCLILGIASILTAFDYNQVGSFILGVGLIIGSCASTAGLVQLVTDHDKHALAESQ